jgi:hypothetical protein
MKTYLQITILAGIAAANSALGRGGQGSADITTLAGIAAANSALASISAPSNEIWPRKIMMTSVPGMTLAGMAADKEVIEKNSEITK